MKKLIIQDDFAFIYLNRNFYNKNNIIQALNDYHDFLNWNLNDLGKYFIIKIKLNSNLKDYNLKEVSNEYLNYLLSLEFENKEELSKQEGIDFLEDEISGDLDFEEEDYNEDEEKLEEE